MYKNSPNQKFWAEFIRFQGRSPRKPAAPTSVRTATPSAHGSAPPGPALPSPSLPGTARHCSAQPDTTQHCSAQPGTTRHDSARLSTTQHARHDPALLGQLNTTQHTRHDPSLLGMEEGMDFLRLGAAHQRRQLADVGRPDLRHRTEMGKQRRDGLLAHPFDLLELAVDERLASFLPMERDGEAVHLVLNARQEVEQRRGGPQTDQQRRIAAVEFGRAVAVILGQTGNRDVEPQRHEHLVDDAHLPLAAVGDNQVGEFASLGLQAAVAAEDHLAHRGVVVGPLDRLDVEVAVLLARGTAVAEDDARGDGVRPLQVGVVEALDVARRPVEEQLLLEGIHQPLGMAFGILDFEVLELLGAVDAGALLREFEQFELLAPLGDGEGHPVEEQRRRGEEGDDDLAGQLAAGQLLDHVLDGQRQHVALVGADPRRQTHGRDPDDGAVTYAHEVAVGHIVVGQQREDVDIANPRADNHRPPGIVVQRVEALLVALRHLEAELGGRTLHLPLEVGAHGAQVALEHRDDHRDLLRILLLALGPDAGSPAVAQMVLQADRIAPPGDGLGREVEFAGAQRHHFADEIQHAVLHHHRAVGAEILRAVADQLPRGLHPREGFAPHDNPRIGLVVLEQDVVTGLERLDERVFEQQGVGLASHDDVADFDDLLHHHAHLGAVFAALHEVGRHALAQALGLAHIDDGPRPVDELVDAGREGQQRHLLLESVCCGFTHRSLLCGFGGNGGRHTGALARSEDKGTKYSATFAAASATQRRGTKSAPERSGRCGPEILQIGGKSLYLGKPDACPRRASPARNSFQTGTHILR